MIRGERGQAGGMEVLPFGLLVFVAGSLLLTNLWGVVDTRFAADAAAREAVRLVVERAGTAPDATVRANALEVARDTLGDRPGEPTVTVASAGADLGRCARVSVTVRTSVPAVRLPFVGGFGEAFTVTATHSGIVDPTRSGVGGVAGCLS